MPDITDLTNREPVAVLPDARERGRLRRAFGVTQAQLAAALGVTRQTVISYEKGSDPNGKTRNDYAAVLNAWQATERERHIAKLHCRAHLEFRSDCPECVSEREFGQ